MSERMRSARGWAGLAAGPLVAGLLLLMGPPESLIDQSATAREAWTVLALLALMASWWVSEAIPIPATSLAPILLLPLFGVLSVREAAAPYMHPIVVLLMGGFIIAKAIQRWNLHARIALNIVVRAGDHPAMLIAGFMAAAALLSMWISNTATSIMLTPIALSVAAATLGGEGTDAPLTKALLLGVAWSCSIGGLGTLVGTPTNLIVVGYLNDNAGFEIDFLQWMTLGLPTVCVLVPTAWLVLTKWAFRITPHAGGAGREAVRARLLELGPMTTPEKRTVAMFAVIAGLWIFRRPLTGVEVFGVAPLGGLTDHMVAILGVFLAFLIPAGDENRSPGLLDWRTAETIPWGVVLLFGGGMSLAGAITATGLGTWIGGELSGLAGLPLIVLILTLTAFVIFTTEVTSNIATAAALMPVLGAVALATGLPVELLAAPLAMAASCAFMLPMATGPNAVVYASGAVSLPTMAAAGFRLNLVAIVLITGIVYVLAPVAFG
ncbi:MAG: DASS family sodium-coupled anion symporter [Pseudomonadota bacterium]